MVTLNIIHHLVTVVCMLVLNLLVGVVCQLFVDLSQLLSSQFSLLCFHVCFCTFFFQSLSYPVSSRPYHILQWRITQQRTCDPWQLSPWPVAVLSLSKLTAIKQHDPAAPLGLSQMGVSDHSPVHLTAWRCCADAVLVEFTVSPSVSFW